MSSSSCRQVADALADENRQAVSVAALKRQLEIIQAEVSTAHERLHAMQNTVALNMHRIQTLKTTGAEGIAQPSSQSGEASKAAEALEHDSHMRGPKGNNTGRPSIEASPHAAAGMHLREAQGSGTWFPAATAKRVRERGMHPFRIAGQSWLLFMSEQGIACVRDECMHRACPLSLVGMACMLQSDCSACVGCHSHSC